MTASRRGRGPVWRHILALHAVLVLAACPDSCAPDPDGHTQDKPTAANPKTLAATLLPACSPAEGEAALARLAPSESAVEARLPHLAPPAFNGPWDCANQERFVALALAVPADTVAALHAQLSLHSTGASAPRLGVLLATLGELPTDRRHLLVASAARLCPLGSGAEGDDPGPRGEQDSTERALTTLDTLTRDMPPGAVAGWLPRVDSAHYAALQAAPEAISFVAARPGAERPVLVAALATLEPDPACLRACREVDDEGLVDTLGLAASMAADARLGCGEAVAAALTAGDAEARRAVAAARGRLSSCPTLPTFIAMAAAIAVDDAPLFATMCLVLTRRQQQTLTALGTVDAALGRQVAAQLLGANPVGPRFPVAAAVRLVADLPSAARARHLRDLDALGPIVTASEEVVEALARCAPARRQSVVKALLAAHRGELGLILGAQHIVDQLREADDEPHVFTLVRALRALGFAGYDAQQPEALAILRGLASTDLEAITGLGRRLVARAGTARAGLSVRVLQALVAAAPAERDAAVAAYEALPMGQEALPSPSAFLAARARGAAEPELSRRLLSLADLEERLADLASEQRRDHLQRAQRFIPFVSPYRRGPGIAGLRAASTATSPPPNPIFRRAAAHHRENVEDATWRALAAHNMAILSARGSDSNPETALAEIDRAIATFEETTPPDSTAWRLRGGGHTFANARRALAGSHGLVAPEISTAQLLAWVWECIERYPEHSVDAELEAPTIAAHRNLMRWAVIKALEQCIEDDGNRVCCNGTAQRLTFALAGYIEGILRPDVVSGTAVFNIEVEGFRAHLRQQAQEAGTVLAPLPANDIFPEPGLETPEATIAQFEAWMARMREVYHELTGRRREEFLLATRAAAPSFAAWPDYAAAHPDFPGAG